MAITGTNSVKSVMRLDPFTFIIVTIIAPASELLTDIITVVLQGQGNTVVLQSVQKHYYSDLVIIILHKEKLR